jgi:lipopolysaccharide export system permease protein
MIVHRYILGQVLWPVVTAFLSLNLLFLVVQLLKVAELAVGVGLGTGDLFKITLLFLPGFAVFTIPISVLTGVLLAFGRLAEDGELVALGSAGISTLQISVVPLGLGVAAGLFSMGIAGFAAPASTAELHRTFVGLSRQHVAYSLHPGQFFEEIPGVVLYPHRQGEQADSWDGFLMYDRRPGRAHHILVARRARVEPAGEKKQLSLELHDGEVHARNRPERLYTIARFARARVGIDIERLIYDRTRFISSSEQMTLGELSSASRNLSLPPQKRAAYASTLHRRFAFPVAAVLFSLLGCALGASGKLRGRRRTLLASVLVVASFYLLMRIGDAAVSKGWLNAAPAAWIPNFLVAALLVWLFERQSRRPG